MPSIDRICRVLDRFAPPQLAAEWDNTGLLLGDASLEVRKVLTCLTLTDDVADEAIIGNFQLVVTHHPILFRALKNLSSQNREGRMMLRLARAGVAVYSPHTRFDNALEGINAWIARGLGLERLQPLRWLKSNDEVKIAVFVPEEQLAKVSQAMFDAGAGRIGEYAGCSFRVPGTGTFQGSEMSNPQVGRKGVPETVIEIRLEVLCPQRLVEAVVSAMLAAHSYEEPAYDIYPLQSLRSGQGEGRIASYPVKKSLGEIVPIAKRLFGTSHLQMVGEADRPIGKVAIVCGAAGEFLSDAIRKRADLFITGEMRFHELLKARQEGIAVLMPGHYASERPAVDYLADWLAGQFPGIGVMASQRETDPLSIV